MQERDEDLYYAYEKIEKLQRNSLRHWLAHVLMISVIAVLFVIKRRL